MISIGQKAPSFTLITTETNEVSLSDFSGKNLLLLFFPLAFTGVCTDELCAMRDSLAHYNDMNCEIVAISVDSPFTLAEFKKQNSLTFPLLSDFNAQACTAYHAKYEDFVLGLKNVAKRSAFIIDTAGIIQYAEVLEDAHDLPNFEAIKTIITSL